MWDHSQSLPEGRSHHVSWEIKALERIPRTQSQGEESWQKAVFDNRRGWGGLISLSDVETQIQNLRFPL